MNNCNLFAEVIAELNRLSAENKELKERVASISLIDESQREIFNEELKLAVQRIFENEKAKMFEIVEEKMSDYITEREAERAIESVVKEKMEYFDLEDSEDFKAVIIDIDSICKSIADLKEESKGQKLLERIADAIKTEKA